MAGVYHAARGPGVGIRAPGSTVRQHAPRRLTLGSGKASPEAQLRLLELADLDTVLARLDHRRRALPEIPDLEEIVLELMEKLEEVTSRRDEAAAARDTLAAQTQDATARRDAALAEIAEAAGKASASRASAVAGVPADLLALYDKVRAQASGIGAAMLRRGRCEGCRESLPTAELNAIRAAAPDEVIRHEECRRILVRTSESGL